MRKSTEKVRSAAETARPYVERAITDDEFRDSLHAAFVAAKEIYEELMPPKGVTGFASKVAKNEDVQESLVRVPFRIVTKEEEKILSKNWKDIRKQVQEAFKKGGSLVP